MKKLIIILAVFCLIFNTLAGPVSAASIKSTKKPPLSMQLMDKKFSDYGGPILVGNWILVPLRTVGAELGYTLSWSDKTQTMTVAKGNQMMKFTAGKKEAVLNGKKVKMNVAATMYKQRLYIPFAIVRDNFNCSASYDTSKNVVIIKAKASANSSNQGSAKPSTTQGSGGQVQTGKTGTKSVIVMGKALGAQDVPYLNQGKVFVPIRTVSAALGYQSSWNAGAKTIALSSKVHSVKVTVGQATAYSNGKKVKMEAAAVMVNGKVYVPLTFIKGYFNCNTAYDSSKAIAWIESKNTAGIPSRGDEDRTEIATIGDISYDENVGYPQLNIIADKPIEFTSSTMSNPDRMVVDINNAIVGTDYESKEINKGGILRARIGQYSLEPNIVRVVIDLNNPKTCSIVQSTDKKSIALVYANTIKSITTSKDGNSDILTVKGSSALDINIVRADDINKLFIDVKGATLEGGDRMIQTSSALFNNLSAGQFGVGTIRLSMDITPGVFYDVKNSGDSVKIVFSNLPFSFFEYEKYYSTAIVNLNPNTEVDYMPSISEDKKVLTILIPKDLNVEQRTYNINDNILQSIDIKKQDYNGAIYTLAVFNMRDLVNYELLSAPGGKAIDIKFAYKPQRADQIKIAIDAGHGGKDPGATSQDKTLEKDLNMDVANRLNAILKGLGFQTLMTRTDDSYVPLASRTTPANQNYVDFFMCIHFNAFSSKTKGIETLYYPNSVSSQYEFDNKAMAQIFHSEVTQALKRSSRGITARPDLFVLNKTKMPAILEELGFITNPEELSQIKTEAYREMAARSLAVSIIRFFKEIEGVDLGIDTNAIYNAPIPGSSSIPASTLAAPENSPVEVPVITPPAMPEMTPEVTPTPTPDPAMVDPNAGIPTNQ